MNPDRQPKLFKSVSPPTHLVRGMFEVIRDSWVGSLGRAGHKHRMQVLRSGLGPLLKL